MLVLNSINYCYFHPGELADSGEEVSFGNELFTGAELAAHCIFWLLRTTPKTGNAFSNDD